MPLPARNTLAVIGAGPVGLEVALASLDAGFDVHVFERGEVGAHPIAWGHVRMFTPWRMNVGPASRAHLERAGWQAPESEACPTGLEFAERCLEPVSRLPELAGRVHTHAQVVHVSRRGLLASDGDRARRAAHPFRLLVRDAGGRENFLHAFGLVDASGVYGQPRWAGDGGIPARGELYLAPQISYHVDDVLGLRRARYAGRRTLVLGSGASAATVAADLAHLANEVEGTSVVWVTRKEVADCYAERPGDPLPRRRDLYARARAWLAGADGNVTPVGGATVEGFEYNSATHRYRVTLRIGEALRQEEADQVVVNAGYGPDESLWRELQVGSSWATRGPVGVAEALAAAAADHCLAAPVLPDEALENPEPGFHVLGHKSYGRAGHFLLDTGYRQVARVVTRLRRDLEPTPAAR
jgi:thioredoxin reductase